MSPKGCNNSEAGLGETIQTLIVSSIRLSTGLTLYGIGQLQKIFDAATGDKGLPEAAEKLESTFEELSKSLESNMDETKREALRSVSRVAAKAVEKAFETFYPAAILEARNRLLGRRDDTPADATPASAPLAVDVLSGPPGD
jgi:hypothetical protein